jgi:hypothetical protein
MHWPCVSHLRHRRTAFSQAERGFAAANQDRTGAETEIFTHMGTLGPKSRINTKRLTINEN